MHTDEIEPRSLNVVLAQATQIFRDGKLAWRGLLHDAMDGDHPGIKQRQQRVYGKVQQQTQISSTNVKAARARLESGRLCEGEEEYGQKLQSVGEDKLQLN